MKFPRMSLATLLVVILIIAIDLGAVRYAMVSSGKGIRMWVSSLLPFVTPLIFIAYVRLVLIPRHTPSQSVDHAEASCTRSGSDNPDG